MISMDHRRIGKPRILAELSSFIMYLVLLLIVTYYFNMKEVQLTVDSSEQIKKILTENQNLYKQLEEKYKFVEARLLSEKKTTIDISNWNCAIGYVTAYSPYDNVSGIECDSNPLSTSIGKVPGPGTIAVDPEKIPYGSVIMVVYEDGTIEYGVAEDTGATMRNSKKMWIDVYRHTYKETVYHGKRQAQIFWKTTKK